jgi:hypothetical protein
MEGFTISVVVAEKPCQCQSVREKRSKHEVCETDVTRLGVTTLSGHGPWISRQRARWGKSDHITQLRRNVAGSTSLNEEQTEAQRASVLHSGGGGGHVRPGVRARKPPASGLSGQYTTGGSNRRSRRLRVRLTTSGVFPGEASYPALDERQQRAGAWSVRASRRRESERAVARPLTLRRKDSLSMLVSSSEAGWPWIQLRERVTGFPGLRPVQANPRMLAWE